MSELKPLVLAMEDFINQPASRDAVETPEVRDYRHEAYRVWSPLCRAILDAARSDAPQGEGEGVVEVSVDAARRSSEKLNAFVSSALASGLSESWHGRLQRLVSAKDYAGALELLRHPAPPPKDSTHD